MTMRCLLILGCLGVGALSIRAESPRERRYDQVYSNGTNRYVVAADAGVNFSDGLWFLDTGPFNLPAPFDRQPAYVVVPFFFPIAEDQFEFTAVLTADDLFARPIELGVRDSKTASKPEYSHRQYPYALREEFRARYPQGITRTFVWSIIKKYDDWDRFRIVLKDSPLVDTVCYTPLIRGVEIRGLHPELTERRLITPDTTRRTPGIWGTYLTEEYYADNVFAIELKKDGTGMFYGNTDLLDEGPREGYLAGLYAVPMKNIRIQGSAISFTIELTSSDLCDSHFYILRIPWPNAHIISGTYTHTFVGTVSENRIVLSKEGTYLYEDLVLKR